MRNPHIPRDWTNAEAIQVATFLQSIIDDIWAIYGLDLGRAVHDHIIEPDPECSPGDGNG